jgi:hypothetical protein
MERAGSAFLPCESIKHIVLIAKEVIHKLQKKKKSLRFFYGRACALGVPLDGGALGGGATAEEAIKAEAASIVLRVKGFAGACDGACVCAV